jgi:hypothetical protein
MPKILAGRRISLMAAVLAAALCGAAHAADMEEGSGGDAKIQVRTARACTDNCIADCRTERTECKDAKADENVCRATFQICARRCVVACSPR